MKTIKDIPVTDGEHYFYMLVKNKKQFTAAEAKALHGTGRENVARIITQLRAKGLVENVTGISYRVVK